MHVVREDVEDFVQNFNLDTRSERSITHYGLCNIIYKAGIVLKMAKYFRFFPRTIKVFQSV